MTALMLAAVNRRDTVVKVLLDKGADASVTDMVRFSMAGKIRTAASTDCAQQYLRPVVPVEFGCMVTTCKAWDILCKQIHNAK